jgi:hypothetical protein
MTRTHTALLCLAALALAVGRFFVPTRELSAVGTYQAFAHLFVGGLAGAWCASRRWVFLVLFVVLAAVELVAFLSRG